MAARAEDIKVLGEDYTQLPDDLYIPPDALRVFLEAFEGPLDLLLYLIRRQNLDILNIPVARICEQYIEYIRLMREIRFELAAEYLLMAAWLAEIKSRMLLPREPVEEEEDVDPRAELVRRLQEYERYKTAARNLDERPRMERDIFMADAAPAGVESRVIHPQPGVDELIHALRDVLTRAEMFTSHQVTREPISVRERMSRVLANLSRGTAAEFMQLLEPSEGRAGVVVTFLAVLELTKAALVVVEQKSPNAPLNIRIAGPHDGSSLESGL